MKKLTKMKSLLTRKQAVQQKKDAADRARIAANIEKYGQHLVGVMEPDSDLLPFTYSVGMHQLGLPEILIIGLEPGMVAGVINHLCDIQRSRGVGYKDGELIDIGGKYPVKAIDVTGYANMFVTFSPWYYGQPVKSVQILVPDKKGIFPDDSKCDPLYGFVPILNPHHSKSKKLH